MVDDRSKDGSWEVARAAGGGPPRTGPGLPAGGEQRRLGGAPQPRLLGEATRPVRDVPRQRRHPGAQRLPQHGRGGRGHRRRPRLRHVRPGARRLPPTARRVEWYPWGCTRPPGRSRASRNSPTCSSSTPSRPTSATGATSSIEQAPDPTPSASTTRTCSSSAQAYVAAPPHHPHPRPRLLLERLRQEPPPSRSATGATRSANFAHRMEIHRRSTAPGAPRPARAAARQGRQVPQARPGPAPAGPAAPDEEYRAEFAALSPRVPGGPLPRGVRQLLPIQAICSYLLQQGDWDNLLPPWTR